MNQTFTYQTCGYVYYYYPIKDFSSLLRLLRPIEQRVLRTIGVSEKEMGKLLPEIIKPYLEENDMKVAYQGWNVHEPRVDGKLIRCDRLNYSRRINHIATSLGLMSGSFFVLRKWFDGEFSYNINVGEGFQNKLLKIPECCAGCEVLGGDGTLLSDFIKYDDKTVLCSGNNIAESQKADRYFFIHN